LELLGEKMKEMREEEKLSFGEICRRLCEDFGDPLNPVVVARDCMVPNSRNKSSDRLKAAEFMVRMAGLLSDRVEISGRVDHELRKMSDEELLLALVGDKEKFRLLMAKVQEGGVERLLESFSVKEDGKNGMAEGS
jgi:hypothetical protein